MTRRSVQSRVKFSLPILMNTVEGMAAGTFDDNQRCILNSMSALPGVAEFSQFSSPAQAFLARMNACRWLGKPQFLVCLIEAV